MRVRERDGHRCIARLFPLNTDHRLIKRRGNEVRAHLFTNLHGLKPRQRRDRRRRRKEIRIRKYVLLLADAVAAKRRHGICQSKTIIEDAKSGARHGLWRQSPRDAGPRRQVMPVTNVGLRFVTEAEAHGQRPSDFPVVTNEDSEIELTYCKAWVTCDDAELAGATTASRNL